MDKKRFVYETAPKADTANTVSGEKYRFTVLTSRLIRLEYSADGVFEDRASQTVFFRNLGKTNFTASTENGVLTLETDGLKLTYRENEKFSADTFEIRLKNEPCSVWRFGEDFEDLGGTAKTLDEADGEIPIGRGVCSKNGFSVLDDKESMLLNDYGYVEARKKDTEDSYFFGYGFDYKQAVKDFYRITGAPPMLPAFALGNWWSRYHAYTQDEYEALVERFEQEDVPFSVGVVDMDWHIVDIPENLREKDKNFADGWTGYSWNKELFPDYKAFLKFLKDHNLKTALNLHPHAGVRRHEDMYEEMARRCGVDPKSGKRIPFDILSPEFMENYFDVLHHPYEEDGVDFWWMDWQQGTTYWWIHEENKDGKLQDEREVLDPLWMLNHLHIADIKRNGKRPMFFSRFSGPGSHRYPVGFSGDSFVTWESLDFQPYFTNCASNIGYGWWSHDIGGHGDGYRDDELMTRWVQLGVFSPINRLHSTNNDFIRKEPWCFKDSVNEIIKKYLRLRHSLFPYIYTMNYRNHAELEPLVQPMYYAYPKTDGAYRNKNQFMFGSELMVAPITSPDNSVTELGKTNVWFPSGDWFDFFDGTHYHSDKPRFLNVFRRLDKYPVFAKAGAIVPAQTSRKLEPDKDITVTVFPCADNSFTLYEDAGDGNDFENGKFVKTEMSLKWGKTPVFTISPPHGALELIPETRTYRIVLKGYSDKISVKTLVNGNAADCAAEHNAAEKAVTVTVTAPVTAEIRLEISGASLVTDNGALSKRCTEILQRAQCATKTKCATLQVIEKYEKLIEDGGEIDYNTSALNHACSNGRDFAGLREALREQIFLVI